jgi:preprotein translocase subunit YajC
LRRITNLVEAFIPILLIALAFVVLVVLPGRARMRQAQAVQRMQRSLDIGTEVMTSSGLYGRIVRLGADDVDLEIAPGVVTTWSLLAVREAKSPSMEPAARDADDVDDAELLVDPDEPDTGPGRPSAGAD